VCRFIDVILESHTKSKTLQISKKNEYFVIQTVIQGWKLAGPQSAKAPKNLAGLLEIGIYFSYLYRFGLLIFLSELLF
jgi:hypothetical protein